jgi:poly-gamma-glutamate system protein
MNKRRIVILYVLAALALGAFLFFQSSPRRAGSPRLASIEREASQTMARAENAVRACRLAKGIAIDPQTDPNDTGLIGLPTSSITTSLGSLEAKRTTTNPAFAGLLVRLIREAGARRGDVVAVGASSSFPALVIATLSACRVLGVEPLVISSLGSSEWGANIPEFNWWDIEDCLNASGVLSVHPIAYSIGGIEDRGADMSPAGRGLIMRQAAGRGVRLLEEPGLEATVAARMRLTNERAGGRPLKAFINIGGSWVNLGLDSRVLNVKPGLNMKGGRNEIRDFPPPEKSGMIFAMARRGIPVIHLLYVKGLCRDYGIPWDPPAPKTPSSAPGTNSSVLFFDNAHFFGFRNLSYQARSRVKRSRR